MVQVPPDESKNIIDRVRPCEPWTIPRFQQSTASARARQMQTEKSRGRSDSGRRVSSSRSSAPKTKGASADSLLGQSGCQESELQEPGRRSKSQDDSDHLELAEERTVRVVHVELKANFGHDIEHENTDNESDAFVRCAAQLRESERRTEKLIYQLAEEEKSRRDLAQTLSNLSSGSKLKKMPTMKAEALDGKALVSEADGSVGVTDNVPELRPKRGNVVFTIGSGSSTSTTPSKPTSTPSKLLVSLGGLSKVFEETGEQLRSSSPRKAVYPTFCDIGRQIQNLLVQSA